jgi:glycosyltransferase involved in cell wall biosynthesis
MESHIVGYWVSRRLGLPWIANIDDPWDWHLFPDAKKESFSRLQMHMSNFCLNITLKTADLITYPSIRLWKYHEYVSGIPHHAEVIPHIGYSCNTAPDPGKVTFVHAGKLGANEVTMRSPAGFLRAFKKILDKFPDLKNKMEINFVGPEDDMVHRMTIDLGLEDNVNFTGRVQYQKSLKYICSANVCILVEGKMKEGIYLPSKFADYIVSNKPVIALSPKNGTIADLSKYKGIYRVDPDDDMTLEGVLMDIISIIKNNEYKKILPSEELVNMFKESSVMDRLNGCLNDLVHGRVDLPGTVQ